MRLLWVSLELHQRGRVPLRRKLSWQGEALPRLAPEGAAPRRRRRELIQTEGGPRLRRAQIPFLHIFSPLSGILECNPPGSVGGGCWLTKGQQTPWAPRPDLPPLKERALVHRPLGTQTWTGGGWKPLTRSSLCVYVTRGERHQTLNITEPVFFHQTGPWLTLPGEGAQLKSWQRLLWTRTVLGGPAPPL